MLLLARHGVTALNETGRVQGVTNHDLSDTGIEQARRLADWLLKSEFMHLHIYSSPAKRAMQTAIVISNAVCNQDSPTLVEAFQERHFGPFEGVNRTELLRMRGLPDDTSPEIIEFWSNVPGVETDSEVEWRVREALANHEVLRDCQERDVLLVTHAGVIEVLLPYILGIPATESKWIKVPPASCVGVTFRYENARLSFLYPNLLNRGWR